MELVHSIAEGKPHDDTDVQFLSQSYVSKRQQQQQHQRDTCADILSDLDGTGVEQVVNNAIKYKALNALYQIISNASLACDREQIANQVATILRNSCLPSAGGNTKNINAQCFHSATLTGNAVVIKELVQNASSPVVLLKGLKMTFNYTFDMIGKCHPRRLNCIQLAAMLGYKELVEIFHSILESNLEVAPTYNIFNVQVTIPTTVANDDDNDMIAHRLTPLMLATRFGHVDTVKRLLELKVQCNDCEYDVNFKSYSGYTALHFAVCYNRLDCLRALIELGGADVNAATYGYVKYPLAFSAGLGHYEITRELVHTTERKGLELAVHVAAALGRDRDVGILLMAHSSLLQAKDSEGNSVLAVALKADHASTVDRLLYRSINFDSRADAVKAPNDSGTESIGLSNDNEPEAESENNLDDVPFTRPKTSTARVCTRFMKLLKMKCIQSKRQKAHDVDMLHNAVYKNNLELVEELLQLGVNPNHTDRNGNNFLHVAADENRGNIIDSCLLRFEHLLEMKNAQGETPLHIAVRKGHDSAVKSLIRNIATLGLSDKDGRTPLLLAARYHQEKVMDVLVKAIQSAGWYELLNARDAGRRTALHYAVSFHKQPECRCISILSSLDPSAEDQKLGAVEEDTSGSVLHLAASVKNPELLKQVLKTFYSSSERSRRRDVDAVDISGRTALMVCVDNEDIDGVEALLNSDVNLEARDCNKLTVLHRMVLHSVQSPEKALTMLQIFQTVSQNIARKRGELDVMSTVGSNCRWCRRTDVKFDEYSRRTHLLTHLFSPMTRFIDNASTEPLSMSALQLAAAVGAAEMMQAFVDSINKLDSKSSEVVETKPDERTHENRAMYSPSQVIPTALYSDQCVLDESPNQLSALELIMYIGHQNAVKMTATRPLNVFFHRFSRLRSIVFCLLSLFHLAHMTAFSWAVVPTCTRYTSTLGLYDRPTFTCFLIWPTMVFSYLILRLVIFVFRILTGRTKNYTYRYLISIADDYGTVFKYTIFKTINYLLCLIFFACNVAWLILWGELDSSNFLRYAQMVSVILIIGWFHTMEYIKGIKYFHSFSKYIKLIFFKDIFRFAVVYFLVLIGFSLALQIYVQLDLAVSPGVNGNATIVDTVFSTFGLMIGMTSVYGTDDSNYMHVGYLFEGSNPISSKVLITIYLCLTTIILLNVLIAMLNKSYTLIDEEIQLMWIYENMMLACNLAGSGLWFIEAPVRWLMRWMVFADKSGNLVVDLDKKSRTRSMLNSN